MRGVPHTLGLQVSLERDTALRARRARGDDRLVRRWRAGNGLVARLRDRRRDSAFHEASRARRGHRLQAAERAPAGCHGSVSALARPEQGLRSWPRLRSSLRRRTSTPARVSSSTAARNPDVTGTCNFCHTNGGALSAGLQNQNRNFNTNVEDRPHPARTQVQNFPKDGGFGRNANATAPSATARSTRHPWWKRPTPRRSSITTSRASPKTPTTPKIPSKTPFASTSDPEFNNPRAPAAQFSFNDTQIDQLVAFLRGLNTIQNIEVARQELAEILANNGNPRREQDTRLQTAFDETQDGIDVLTAGNLYPTAKSHLISARNFISQAQVTEDPSQRRSLIQQAIAKLDAAKSAVATIAP